MTNSAAGTALMRVARRRETPPARLVPLYLLVAALVVVNMALCGSLLVADDVYDAGFEPSSLLGGHHASGGHGLLQPVFGIEHAPHFSEAEHQLGHTAAKGGPEGAADPGVTPPDFGFEFPGAAVGSPTERASIAQLSGKEFPLELLGRPPPA